MTAYVRSQFLGAGCGLSSLVTCGLGLRGDLALDELGVVGGGLRSSNAASSSASPSQAGASSSCSYLTAGLEAAVLERVRLRGVAGADELAGA